MRVALVTPMYWPVANTGSTQVMQELAEGLAATGHDCTVYCCNGLTGASWVMPFVGGAIRTLHEDHNGVHISRLKMMWPDRESIKKIPIQRFILQTGDYGMRSLASRIKSGS